MQLERYLCAAALIAAASACSKEQPAPSSPAPTAAAQPAPAPEAPKPAPSEPVANAKLAAQVLFDFGAATIRPDGHAALDEMAGSARKVPAGTVTATGYADRIGSVAYNQALSQRRADAVKAYLASKGLEAARIRSEGKGESESVTGDKCAKGDNRRDKKLIACLQPDRRVEIEVTGTR
jgi:OOP family OmpA-OmpF porin